MLRCSLLMLPLFLTLSAGAGELNPPGAPTATSNPSEPRTPISALPFVIDSSGSYHLTQSLTGAAGDGITINASDVTLDLNGFTLRGGVGSGVGIYATLDGVIYRRGLVVRNGTVRGWGSLGVGLNADHSRVEDLIAYDNANTGISVNKGCIVTRCVAQANVGRGIRTGDNSLVQACVARENGNGIEANAGSTVQDCVASNNELDGIISYNAGIVVNCQSNNNGSDGIALQGAGHRIEGNYTRSNLVGYNGNGGASSLIIRNAAANNGTAYLFTSFNLVGPIVTNASGMATASPWANFSY